MSTLILFVIIFGPIIVGCFFLYHFMTQAENKVEQQMRDFAVTTGGTYWKGSAVDADMASLLLSEPGSPYIQHLISYSDGTKLGEARFTTGADSHSTILFDFASVQFNKYPELWLVVDSRRNNLLGRSLMDTVGVAQKLTPIRLEGNFPQTYKVYMNKGEQIAALTALNPASMQTLLDIFSTYDMEICSSRLYLYQIGTRKFYKEEARQQILKDIQALARIL